MVCTACGWPIIIGPAGCACTQRAHATRRAAEAAAELAKVKEVIDNLVWSLDGLWFLVDLKRVRFGWSMRKLARELGLSPSTITRWGQGKGEPSGSAVLVVLRWLHEEPEPDPLTPPAKAE